MNKSSSELPIIVLDSTKSCEISAPVEIEGVVFTHEENLSFNNLQNYADEDDFDDDYIEGKNYRDDDFASCLLVNSDAKLKNVAVLDSLTYGITLAKTKGTIEDSIISNCYDTCLFCVEKTEATVQETKILNSECLGVDASETSNPCLKDCEIYGNGVAGMAISGRGTFEGCHIYDNTEGIRDFGRSTFEGCHIHDNGCEGIFVARGSTTYTNCHVYNNAQALVIYNCATPSFVGCKIYANRSENYPGVLLEDSSNPSIKDCEIYGHLSNGIWVKDQAKGTYKNCYIHNNKDGNFSNETSNTIDTSTCKMG